MQKFEDPDPCYWVKHRYAVVNLDVRGGYRSEGVILFFGSDYGRDGKDIIDRSEENYPLSRTQYRKFYLHGTDHIMSEKPVYEHTTDWDWCYCPNCYTILDREYMRYCDSCSQALSWHGTLKYAVRISYAEAEKRSKANR